MSPEVTGHILRFGDYVLDLTPPTGLDVAPPAPEEALAAFDQPLRPLDGAGGFTE